MKSKNTYTAVNGSSAQWADYRHHGTRSLDSVSLYKNERDACLEPISSSRMQHDRTPSQKNSKFLSYPIHRIVVGSLPFCSCRIYANLRISDDNVILFCRLLFLQNCNIDTVPPCIHNPIVFCINFFFVQYGQVQFFK